MSYKEDKNEFLEGNAKFAEIVDPIIDGILRSRERVILGLMREDRIKWMAGLRTPETKLVIIRGIDD